MPGLTWACRPVTQARASGTRPEDQKGMRSVVTGRESTCPTCAPVPGRASEGDACEDVGIGPRCWTPAGLTQRDCPRIAQQPNARPRKRLGDRPPLEVYAP